MLHHDKKAFGDPSLAAFSSRVRIISLTVAIMSSQRRSSGVILVLIWAATSLIYIQLEVYPRVWFLLLLVYCLQYTKHRFLGARRYRKPVVIIQSSTLVGKLRVGTAKKHDSDPAVAKTQRAPMPWIKALHEKPTVVCVDFQPESLAERNLWDYISAAKQDLKLDWAQQ